MTTTILNPVLSQVNSHERDKNIQFFEEGHKYIILTEPNTVYTSVTTWNHTHFPKFDADGIIKNMMKGKNWKEGHKYWGLTAEQIKTSWSSNASNVSTAGTDLHYEIECFMNEPTLSPDYTHKELYDLYVSNTNHNNINNTNNIHQSIEWQYFINFVKDFPHLKPYRTEWMVYNEDIKLSGSIDMIYENPDGTLSIYDWKRAKEITKINKYNKYAITKEICEMPDTNYWHYSLQLNTYKAILEEKYNKKIKDMYLVRLHPDAEENNYELIQVVDLSTIIHTLFNDLKTNQLKI